MARFADIVLAVSTTPLHYAFTECYLGKPYRRNEEEQQHDGKERELNDCRAKLRGAYISKVGRHVPLISALSVQPYCYENKKRLSAFAQDLFHQNLGNS